MLMNGSVLLFSPPLSFSPPAPISVTLTLFPRLYLAVAFPTSQPHGAISGGLSHGNNKGDVGAGGVWMGADHMIAGGRAHQWTH